MQVCILYFPLPSGWMVVDRTTDVEMAWHGMAWRRAPGVTYGVVNAMGCRHERTISV
jgi:hypothetical protein